MNIIDRSLYLVLSGEYCPGRSLYDITASAIKGGVDILQMREKGRSRDEMIDLGKDIAGLCRENNVRFIVNDDPYLARDLGSDGVHLGQEDIKTYSLGFCREILGEEKIVGLSTHSLDQFKKANEEDFDYIAFGPIFHTQTKDYFIGADDIPAVLGIAEKPVVFIGGINLSNIDIVLGKGAKNIALIRAIVQADDVENAARQLKDKILIDI